MLQSLNHLTLSVSNLQTSLTFWRDLLGLQLHAEWDTGAYLTCGDLWICLSYDVSRNYVARRKATTPTMHSASRQKILNRSRIS